MSTQAYVDLMFAWGHARLGDEETARRLMFEAEARLRPSGDRAHAWLLEAFTYRIEQAIARQPHGRSLPAAFLQSRDLVDEDRTGSSMSRRYVVDRMRQSSRILEPDDQVDPYLAWKDRVPRQMHPLERLLNRGQADRVPEQYERMRREAEWSGDPIKTSRFHFTKLLFRGALAQLLSEPVLSAVQTFTTDVLTRKWTDDPNVAEWFTRHRSKPKASAGKREWDRYHADAADPGAWVEDHVYSSARGLFRSALEFAEAAGQPDWVQRLTKRFLTLQLGPELSVNARRRLGAIAEELSRVIIRLGLRELAAHVCDRLRVERLLAEVDGGEDEPMLACLGLGRLNQMLGRPAPVHWVLDQTRDRLPHMKNPAIQSNAIGEYIELSSRFDWADSSPQLRGLLNVLPRMPNTYTTATTFPACIWPSPRGLFLRLPRPISAHRTTCVAPCPPPKSPPAARRWLKSAVN